MKVFFIIFLVVPLIEIYLLIKIGSIVGAGLTVFLVVFTAILGAYLVRAQGFSTLGKVQSQLARAQVPAVEIIEGLFLFVAGALLLTPGFFTDAIGFICLTPPLRRMIIHGMLDKGMLRGFASNIPPSQNSRSAYGSHYRPGDKPSGTPTRVIEGEFKDLD